MTNVIDRQNEEPAGSNRKIVRLLAWEGSPEADRRIRDDRSEQAGTSANRSRERLHGPNQIRCSELALGAASGSWIVSLKPPSPYSASRVRDFGLAQRTEARADFVAEQL